MTTGGWSTYTFVLYYIIAVIVIHLVKRNMVIDVLSGTNKRKWHAPAFFAMLLLAILATLRTAQVGSDTSYYVREFLLANTTNLKSLMIVDLTKINQEFGYMILTYAIRCFTANYHVYFFIVYSFIAFAYINYLINTVEINDFFPVYYIFIVYYVMNMSGLRAGIMTGFLLCSFVQQKKGSNIKAIVLTLIAASFHYTGIINLAFILIGFLFNNRNKIAARWKWLILMGAGVIFINYGVYYLRGFFIETRYKSYAVASVGERSFLGSIFIIFTFICCFIYYKRLCDIDENGRSKRFESTTTLTLATAYPSIYLINAYRIPNYYIIPRLSVLSSIAGIWIRKQRSQLFLLLIYVIVFIYILFRFYQISQIGNFAYLIFE